MDHAAYVTADFEAGKRRLTSMFGVDSLSLMEDVVIQVPGGEAIVDVTVAKANGSTLEVIYPTGGKDHVYRQLLPSDPDEIVLHHFATRVDGEAEWNMVLEAVDRHGIDVPVNGYSSPATDTSISIRGRSSGTCSNSSGITIPAKGRRLPKGQKSASVVQLFHEGCRPAGPE